MNDKKKTIMVSKQAAAEEKKVFWVSLVAMLFIGVLSHAPRSFFMSDPQFVFAASALTIMLGVNLTTALLIRHIQRTTNLGLKVNLLIVMGICVTATIIEFFIDLFLIVTVSELFNLDYLFDSIITAGVEEVWFLFAWAVLYISFTQNIISRQQEDAITKANTLAQQAQLNMLRYQLNPHFLFNTLNSLSALVLQQRNDEAESVLMRLSQFLRYTLDTTTTQLISLQEEIAVQKHYLEIEKVRFQERLNVEFDVDPALNQALIPSLLLQPLVENAIKHVVANNQSTTTITIRAREKNGMLEITVMDDGPGMPDPSIMLRATGKKVGIRNTAERLVLVYGKKARFDVANREHGGLKIMLNLPLNYGD